VTQALNGAQKLILLEANAASQLGRLLRQETGVAPNHFVARYDGLPFTPEYVLRGLSQEV
jgi:2-oxoglutarate ferredoxin oxidoreductase subunit alpha